MLKVKLFLGFLLFTTTFSVGQNLNDLSQLLEDGFKKQPRIKIADKQVKSAEFLSQQFLGAFNPTLNFSIYQSKDLLPSTKSTREGLLGTPSAFSEQYFLTYNLSASKRFQSGLLVTPGIELTNFGEDFSYRLYQAAGLGEFITNRSNVYVQATQPLLRGRGRAYYAAQLDMQAMAITASEWDQFYTVSFQVYSMAANYLEFLSQANNLDIQMSVRDNLTEFKDQLGKLADKDVIPKAELILINANVASQTAAVEQTAFLKNTYYNRLMESVGVSATGYNQYQLEQDTFSMPEINMFDSATYIEYWIGQAKNVKGDLVSAKVRLKQAERNVQFAERNNLPTLDLTASVGYNGIYESDAFDQYIAPIYSNIPGMSYSLGLTFSRPFGMDDTRGNLSRNIISKEINEEILRQVELNTEQLILSSYTEILRYNKAVKESRKAVTFHEQAVNNEYTKLKLGTSTVVNLIQVQSNYARSQSVYNNNLKNLYQALLKFRLNTGTICQYNKEKIIEITPFDLLTLPKPN